MRATSGRPEALRSIAKFLLEERLEELTTTTLAHLDQVESAYAGMPAEATSAKRSGMRRMLELTLTRLSAEEVPAHIQRTTEDIGRQRAEQGFPLPAMVHSIQLDLRALWEAVMDEARHRGLHTDPDFLDSLILVWEATDRNSVELIDAYRRREQELSSLREEDRNRVFSRLLTEGERLPSSVEEASRTLGIAVDADLVVFVVDDVPTGDPAVERARDLLQHRYMRSFLFWFGQELVGLIAPDRRTAQAVVEALSPFGQWRCGTSHVTSLDLVPRGVRLARASLRSSIEPGVRPIDQHWIGSLMSAESEIAESLASVVVSPLLRLKDHEGVLETLTAYLRIGSVTGVAEQTYRHRNTVRNRLHVVEKATGLDLTLPDHTALLSVALAWLRTRAGQHFTELHHLRGRPMPADQ